MKAIRELLASARVLAFYPTLVPFTGSHTAAVFLSQLLYWFAPKDGKVRLTVKHDGKLWLAKTEAEWWQECGLTRQNLRTVEARLTQMGLIEVQVRKFAGQPTRHYHLNLMVFRVGWINRSETVESTTLKRLIQPFPITKITAESTAQKKSTADCAAGTPPGVQVMGKTAGEVKKELEAKHKLEPKVPIKVTAKNLSRYWRQVYGLNHDQFLAEHTLKELGVLAQYGKRVGKHAYPAMRWAIENWAKYRYRVQEGTGMEVGSTPTVYGLLRGCNAAVEGYLQAQVASQPVESAPVQLAAQKVLATDAEVASAIKDMLNDAE